MSANESTHELHQQILENTYLFLEIMGKVSKNLGIERRMEIAPAAARIEEHLARSYGGESLTYESYQDISELARDIGASVWNPKSENVAERLGVVGINNHRIAALLDSTPEGELLEAPQPLWRMLIDERFKLLEIQTDALPPKQRLEYEAALIAVNSGLEAHDRLGDIELIGQMEREDEAIDRLPRLNVQFFSEPALRVWALCSAKVGALPKTPDILIDALNDIEAGGRASIEMRETVAQQWGISEPGLSKEWINHATNALFGSATSTIMDNPSMRSATLVRKVLEEVYSNSEIPELKLKSDASAFEDSRNELTQTLESLDATLKGLSEAPGGHQIPALILTKLSREAETLRDLIQRAGDSWDADDVVMDSPR
jgi:hypothetical protein